jgi:hypothetical protein
MQDGRAPRYVYALLEDISLTVSVQNKKPGAGCYSGSFAPEIMTSQQRFILSNRLQPNNSYEKYAIYDLTSSVSKYLFTRLKNAKKLPFVHQNNALRTLRNLMNIGAGNAKNSKSELGEHGGACEFCAFLKCSFHSYNDYSAKNGHSMPTGRCVMLTYFVRTPMVNSNSLLRRARMNLIDLGLCSSAL